MPKYTWKVKVKNPDKDNKDWLLQLLAKNRGLDTQKKLNDFVNPTLDQITATKITDVEKGLKRLQQALNNKEKVIVYSDYDADGICATAILWETLYDLGFDVMPYVPHRIKEGYGLSSPAIEELAKKGVTLIVTVDHGVTAVKQVEFAKSKSVDVIITDHHVLPQSLPKSVAMVHTTNLCGAGVAWRFAWEIIKTLKPDYKSNLLEKLELAAIATIADLVPLNSGNRAIVKFGLEILSKTKRPGLKSLFRNSKVTGKIGTYEVGHIIAPRINAMGRIEHGMDSLRLVCAKSQKQANELAKLLTTTNSKRQDLTVGAVTSALELVDKTQMVGVISHESWHEGVIGLVASRLVEAHYRPMVVISRGETFSKGSARSIPGFNIVEAIRASSEFLVDAGGHPMAAGFTIETRHIEAFTKKINTYAQTTIDEKIFSPFLKAECTLSSSDVNHSNLEIIQKLEPFGIGNPEPLFLGENYTVEDIRGVGPESKHLKLQVNGISAIGFNLGKFMQEIRPGYKVDLLFTIAKDNYNGNNKLQLKIKDIEIKQKNKA